MPPLATLRAFDAAARHLNIRLAAEELGVTHGAVAQQVRALEASLGVALFEREPRGLALTPAGRAFHPQIRRAFVLIGGAMAAIEPARQHERRGVTVTVTPSFAARWLIPRLGRFAAIAPDVEVRVLASEVTERLGAAGLPDMAVRLAAPPFDRTLEVERLLADDLFPVCSPVVGATLATTDALADAMLLHDAHDSWPLWLELANAPAPRAVGRRFNQTALALAAALDGQGVALAPAALVADDLHFGRLVAPFGMDIRVASERAFYLLVPRLARMRPEVASFRRWLIAECRGDAAEMEE
ncbi:LysR substrate-binding domain-containing protein [Phreatobacter stygius]|uniref:LysR family transcriptional regulator n=1 Tax=Phreatobacter stygius TaxID=1940610 RepID=A0A4D7AW35_9HYPH|nr:LysR substrate-binding domain-containing protein [Phreatobacter stygius]QCI63128.1 LysR family transcriptional regulator [Phreatobacter stygius]